MKISSLLFVVLLVAVAALGLPAAAQASEGHDCAHAPTVASLRTCVAHAAEAGHILRPQFGTALLAELDAAQAAIERGQTGTGVLILKAFIRTVEAQAGKLIHAEHAAHMIAHAQEVIAALGQ
jgi:hypothetical protein